ncbi:hypothetical protein [Streptosporangium roseum]|uniref:hypothetical protein n=1 Tax=Streptosporangium roseum TaxID=2001 RepID=UPI003334912C
MDERGDAEAAAEPSGSDVNLGHSVERGVDDPPTRDKGFSQRGDCGLRAELIHGQVCAGCLGEGEIVLTTAQRKAQAKPVSLRQETGRDEITITAGPVGAQPRVAGGDCVVGGKSFGDLIASDPASNLGLVAELSGVQADEVGGDFSPAATGLPSGLLVEPIEGGGDVPIGGKA